MSQADSARFIFISHSSRDTWVARQIAREVTLAGGTPFLDEAEVEIGEDFEEKILGFLEAAHELLVLLTPWALDRDPTYGQNLALQGEGEFRLLEYSMGCRQPNSNPSREYRSSSKSGT
ncbi:MAG TPA: toll/interleukin-1 receptor domain-containing protein [Blastocatellia bacterium]|nr:toll/interleukin-1 receptor domain-containing protein [Blastocatellia bacterium]